MIPSARYVHTNLIAADFRRLARFYVEVFGCEPVGPERDYEGAALDAATGLAGARLRGVHLRLPGFPDGGPTLELFEYAPDQPAGADAPNRHGYGHIAFAVASVPDAREDVLAHGGSAVGEVVTLRSADGKRVEWCYVRDPEGNVVELQAWSD